MSLNIIKKEISLNVGQPNNLEIIHVMQNDHKSVEITATLYNQNKLYTINTDKIKIKGVTPSGNTIYKNISGYTEHTVTFMLTSDMLISDGLLKLVIVLTENSKQLTTFPFVIRVLNSPGDTTAEDINTVSSLVEEAEKWALLSQSYAVGTENKVRDDVTDNAKYYYEQSNISANKSLVSETNAKESENNAKNSENNAKNSENNAGQSAIDASESKDAAAQKAIDASCYAIEAESFAHGGTGTRESENGDNAKYYYEQTKHISQSFSGIVPMGTIVFADLANEDNQKEGYLFNVSDEFTSDERFADGGGIFYAAGNNVLYTAEKKWDVLAASTVSGVKGSAETEYRQGFVNIKKEDIGLGNVENVSVNDQTPTFSQAETRTNIVSGEKITTILGKIMRFFTDLKAVAFSGSYNDLSDKPTSLDVSGKVDKSGDTMTGKLNAYGGMALNESTTESNLQYLLGIDPFGANGGTVHWQTAANATVGKANTAIKANFLAQNGNGNPMSFNWSGQGGQPSWIWGGNDGQNMYVYSPSNFSVNYANSAGSAVDQTARDMINSVTTTDAAGGRVCKGWLYCFCGSPESGVNIGAPYINSIEFVQGKTGKGWGGYGYAILMRYYDNFSILMPQKNGGTYLGSNENRWNQIYSTNSGISTSDLKEKKDISYIGKESEYDTSMSDEQLEQLIMGIKPVVFKRINGESDRPHHGLISQDFEELMHEIGLTDHAGFIKSPKTIDVEEEVEVEKEFVNNDVKKDTIIEIQKIFKQKEVKGEYTYGFRYEELITDIIRFVQIQKSKANDLELRIKALEIQLTKNDKIL